MSQKKQLAIHFHIHYVTVPGQQLRVVGSLEQIGSWDPYKGASMTWVDGHYHFAEIQVPVDAKSRSLTFEYKYVVQNNGNITWEQSNNRVFKLDHLDGDFNQIIIRDVWEKSTSHFELAKMSVGSFPEEMKQKELESLKTILSQGKIHLQHFKNKPLKIT